MVINIFFGYGIVGLIFSSFVKSLIEKSIEKGIDKLFFLSRDGEIIKKVYDIYSPLYKNAPKSEYIYASRRSLSVASIFSIEDIYTILERKFSPCTVFDLFKNRFGVEAGIDFPISFLKEVGWKNENSRLDYFKDLDKAKKLINLIKDLIIDNASQERERLLMHYNSKGLNNNIFNKGIVDIGHEGSLQKQLNKLLNIQLYGFYFATFDNMKNNIVNAENYCWGYIGNFINDNTHFYKKNILMFENLFLNSSGSFVKFNENNEVCELDIKNEKNRVYFAQEMQKGIIDFNKDIKNTLEDYFVVSKNENINNIVKPFLMFLNKPSIIDVEIFQNMNFENIYNCQKDKYIIEVKNNIANINNSIWKKGAETYNLYSTKKTFMDNIIPIRIQKLYKKFKKDPKSFFGDSKYKILRDLSKYY